MRITSVKKKLEKALPDFTFQTGEEAGQPESNWGSILVRRGGHELPINVSKVQSKGDIRALVNFIKKQWLATENESKNAKK